jgi:hypothetical protein
VWRSVHGLASRRHHRNAQQPTPQTLPAIACCQG